MDRNDPRLGLANENGLLPTKVPIPILPSWVEKRVQLSAEQPSEVRSLGPIAVRARPAQRVWGFDPAVLLCDYVLRMERKQTIIVLMQTAVFAAAACALTDVGPERSVNHLSAELARSWRAFDLRIATTVLYDT